MIQKHQMIRKHEIMRKDDTMQALRRLLLCAIWSALLLACAKRETPLYSQTNADCRIVVNQLGFYPSAQKTALVQGAVRREDTLRFGAVAEVFDTVRKVVVLRVAMGLPVVDAQSRDTLRALDFSILNKDGVYRVRYGGVESAPFRVGRNVYDSLVTLMLRSYYLQRCGVAVRDSANGIHHEACHLHDGIIARADEIHPQGAVIKAQGGWHDAGDYGKYITTSAVAVAELLTVVEEFGKALSRLFGDTMRIPESGNAKPDVLDEVKVALDWMLTMQRSDGAVYRKLSGAAWSPLIAPEAEQQTRFVYGASTIETARFAGTMAQAARVLKPFWGQYADTCLRAAKAAWRYLEKHPQMAVDWQASDDGGSGKYLESEVDREKSLFVDTDDRFYATTELFITTRDSAYLQVSNAIFNNPQTTPDYGMVEWKNAAPLAMTNLNRSAKTDLSKEIQHRIRTHAGEVEKIITASGYRYGNKRIVWGSNKMIAEEAITLLHAYRLTKRRAFLDGAQDQLDFLLGRNPQGICFVSGIGARSVEHICHTFARAKSLTGRRMIPGFLSGGANELEQSGIAPKNQGLKSYADDERSYATNENAIDYNASMIALAVMLIGELEREMTASTTGIPKKNR